MLWVFVYDFTTPYSAAVLHGKIYVTGGQLSSTANYTDAVEVYDPAADTWTKLASLSQRRSYHTSAVVQGKLYVFGGELADRNRTNSVEVYSPASNSWARTADLPFPWTSRRQLRSEWLCTQKGHAELVSHQL